MKFIITDYTRPIFTFTDLIRAQEKLTELIEAQHKNNIYLSNRYGIKIEI